MAVLKMMPHRLEVLSIGESYEDEDGNFHQGKPEWSDYSKCDAVPNGQANTITTPNGDVKQYSYVIYLPKNSREFKTGEKVRISFFGQGVKPEKKEFTVLGFHAYQHQCKMWV